MSTQPSSYNALSTLACAFSVLVTGVSGVANPRAVKACPKSVGNLAVAE